MADAVRFFFDEHMRNAVRDTLRRHGVDVRTAHEVGRCGLPDDDQIRYATADGRAVVTLDIDYVGWAADFQRRGEAFAGVVFCDPDVYMNRSGLLIQDLLILHGVLTAADMQNHLEYL